MEAVKLAECLPEIQRSARLSKPKCEKCQNADAKGFAPYNGDYLNVCDGCAVELNTAEQDRRREKKAEELIPRSFRSARIENLSIQLQAKLKSLPADKGVLFWGLQGVGKSYAMAALMRQFILSGCDVARISYEMLCLQLRDTYKQGSTKTELEVIKQLLAVDKLFIEDVGTTVSTGQQESDFSLRTFLVLLDQRLEACKPTFITTNKSVEELGKSFDQRIASRLQQACEIIHLTGTDRRLASGLQDV